MDLFSQFPPWIPSSNGLSSGPAGKQAHTLCSIASQPSTLRHIIDPIKSNSDAPNHPVLPPDRPQGTCPWRDRRAFREGRACAQPARQGWRAGRFLPRSIATARRGTVPPSADSPRCGKWRSMAGRSRMGEDPLALAWIQHAQGRAEPGILRRRCAGRAEPWLYGRGQHGRRWPRNRSLLAEAVTGDAATPLVTVRQFHSNLVRIATCGRCAARAPLEGRRSDYRRGRDCCSASRRPTAFRCWWRTASGAWWRPSMPGGGER